MATKTKTQLYVAQIEKGKTYHQIAQKYQVAYATVYDMVRRATDVKYAKKRKEQARASRAP